MTQYDDMDFNGATCDIEDITYMMWVSLPTFHSFFFH